MCGIIPAYALFQFSLLNKIRRGNIYMIKKYNSSKLAGQGGMGHA